MKALLLAAGEGQRLGPLTKDMPKPMIRIAGKPILEHHVELLAHHGIRDIAINLHHHSEVVTAYFEDGSRWGVRITYSYEPQLLGTAGAAKALESYFQGTFFVIYGDNLLNCDLTRLLEFHHAHAGLGTIALHYREDASQSGVVSLDERDRVIRFVEKPAANSAFSPWVNAGILVFEVQVLKYIPGGSASDFGKEILPCLLTADQPLYGYRLRDGEGPWWIDTPTDLERTQHLFETLGLG
jgi:NDP-sugar pyrophosphorylase family protein